MDAAGVAAALRERCTYDREAGALYRKPGFIGTVAGSRLGCPDSGGKLQATFRGVRYQVDQLIWLLETGELIRSGIGHANGDNSDNRFENLRRGSAPKARERAFLESARRRFPTHDFSAVDYRGGAAKVTIWCPLHGQFSRLPGAYLASERGCLECARQAGLITLSAAMRARKRKTKAQKLATRRAYQQSHRDLYRRAVKKHYDANKSDPVFRAGRACRNMLARVLGTTKLSKTTDVEALVGYSVAQFKAHIQQQFEPWMTWANHGEWHIDHIFPVVRFLRMGITDAKIINALSNLRPLSKQANLAKRDKLVA